MSKPITREHMLLVDQAVTAAVAEDYALLVDLMGDDPLAASAVQLAAILVGLHAEQDGVTAEEWWRTYCEHAARMREGMHDPEEEGEDG